MLCAVLCHLFLLFYFINLVFFQSNIMFKISLTFHKTPSYYSEHPSVIYDECIQNYEDFDTALIVTKNNELQIKSDINWQYLSLYEIQS